MESYGFAIQLIPGQPAMYRILRDDLPHEPWQLLISASPDDMRCMLGVTHWDPVEELDILTAMARASEVR